jgi:transcriptional regulator with XRE-family HTH domain
LHREFQVEPVVRSRTETTRLATQGGELGAKAEQAELASKLRADGATWTEVAAECRARWGLNARQTIRIARGWSQQDVADEWCRRWPNDPKTFKNISTWERWPERGHAPSLVVLDRLAQLYRCSVADLVADFTDYGCGDDDVTEMDRRTFLAGVGGSLAATLRRADTPAISSEVSAYFSAQLQAHWQADRTFGPHLLIDTVVPQCKTLLGTVDVTRGSLHRELLELATAFTGFVGWLYQDAGDLQNCSRWLAETLELAHRAGDPQLVAYALTCKAMLRVDAGDGTGAVDLAEAALADPAALAPKARVMALQQAAHGRALMGDRADVDRLLNEMGELLEAVDADTHPWGGDRLRRSPIHTVNAQRATCYGLLGLAPAAAEVWDQASRQAPPEDRRDRGVHLARHAAALLDAGRPEDAARRAVEGAQYLQETGSARMRRELRRLHDKTASWTRTPAGRDLHDTLDDIVRRPNPWS